MSVRERAERPSLVERLQGQRERHRARPKIVRVLYAVVGFTVLLGGLAMLVLPGPAFVVIPIGLALLSLEFTWAERALERALVEGEKARQRAAETTPLQRALSAVAVALGCAAFAVWAVLGDVPLLPV